MIVVNKKSDKDFVILNLTDIQLSDEDWTGADAHNRTILKTTVQALVERVRPDLITVTGDLSYSNNYAAYSMLADFLDSFQIPWAPIWGNHDQQGGMDCIAQVVEQYRKHPLFTYESGDSAFGNGNYVIGITEDGKPVSALVMMDSHDRSQYCNEQGVEDTVWAKLTDRQLDWYQQQIEQLKQQGYASTALMLHIPIHAYRLAIEEWKHKEGTTKRYDEQRLREVYVSAQGECNEAVCSYPEDEGMFSRISALGSTRVVVAGHDHINSTILDYKGIKLVYSLKTGAGCYWKSNLNGGTVLRIQTDGAITVHHAFVDATEQTSTMHEPKI